MAAPCLECGHPGNQSAPTQRTATPEQAQSKDRFGRWVNYKWSSKLYGVAFTAVIVLLVTSTLVQASHSTNPCHTAQWPDTPGSCQSLTS